MKIILFIVLVFSININAQNLKEILESLNKSSQIKAINAKRDAGIAQSSLISAYSAPELGVSLSHAKEIDNDGLEYSVGISQEIASPFSNNDKNLASKYSSKALTQETEYEFQIIKLEVASSYYNTCVAQELESESSELYLEQNKRVAQSKRAYEVGEISRKDLLFNQLDLANLYRKVKAYKRVYLDEFASLQEHLDNLELTDLSCNDLITPTKDIIIRDINEHGELKVLDSKLDASRARYSLNDSYFPSIGYELLYEKELDTKRYTLGLSIPLGGSTSQKELLTKEELELSSSYKFEHEFTKSRLMKASKGLVIRLETLYDEYELLKNQILPLNTELLNLSKSAHAEGEGTIMEYLDASRSYSENKLEMLELKKTYYDELFELYKVADMEYGE